MGDNLGLGLDAWKGTDIEKSFIDNDLEKGGEGSRGGHIVGHTKAGNPIYGDPASKVEAKKKTNKATEKKTEAKKEEKTYTKKVSVSQAEDYLDDFDDEGLEEDKDWKGTYGRGEDIPRTIIAISEAAKKILKG